MEINLGPEFESIIKKAHSINKPARVVLAGADSENILKGVLSAANDGLVEPILVGNETAVKSMLKKIDASESNYEIVNVPDNATAVQRAIDIINIGMADILARGNTQTRDFLLPILNKKNNLVSPERLVTHVEFLRIPGYNKLLGVSDVTLLINPSQEQRRMVIINLVDALSSLGITHPSIALLSLIEKAAFRMPDSVEDYTLMRENKETAIADCELVGPISYDLIVSQEAARLKGYDCKYCGKFDGIVVPNLMAGNLLVKVLEHNAGATGFGVLVGTNVPITISGRSESSESTYLALAASVASLIK